VEEKELEKIIKKNNYNKIDKLPKYIQRYNTTNGRNQIIRYYSID